jgi:tRNA (cytidine32/uridine32-2'-O)-methyltransferase
MKHIRIVLVNPSHPGNIGSAARAMKTMGLSRLYLVGPRLYPHPKALELAAGAADVLEQAQVVSTLDEAIQDCHIVIGTSARERAIPWPLSTPREMAETLAQQGAGHEVAVLFGCEQSGLSNAELQRCHRHVHIPTDPTYSSLNLAAAVQVMAYELHLAHLAERPAPPAWDYRLATAQEMEAFFKHLEEALITLDFLKPEAPRQLMARMRRLFLRAQPDIMEINMLRGMLGAIHNTTACQ